MPIKVYTFDTLTHEESPPLLDPTNVLHRVIPGEPLPGLPLMSRIDWYDTTEFRSNEVAQLVEELDSLIGRSGDSADVDYLNALRAIAVSCAANPRCRLRFFGD